MLYKAFLVQQQERALLYLVVNLGMPRLYWCCHGNTTRVDLDVTLTNLTNGLCIFSVAAYQRYRHLYRVLMDKSYIIKENKI